MKPTLPTVSPALPASESLPVKSRLCYLRLPSARAARSLLLSSIVLGTGLLPMTGTTAELPTLQITVNSNQDGPVQADDQLTLREAILLSNGTLPLEELSAAEQAQVESSAAPLIAFNLPPDATTIQLTAALPDLMRPGLTIDGTTQPGYQRDRAVINERPLLRPVVAITPAPETAIGRGLTIAADNTTIRGLSLYGFTLPHADTSRSPTADIFITHRQPPPDISKHPTPANFSPYYDDDVPPKNVVIEQNWLGFAPELSDEAQPPTPATRSAFGVWVFNGQGTVIRNNWIANHDGSAIISSVLAADLQVRGNVLTGNGVAGMPDAIRLEGNIDRAQITGNLICGNDGSGVYLFKPEGSAQITQNQMVYNGRRFRRAAVYLMGNRHQVTENEIRFQPGPGVVVAAYPNSRGNQILGNRFSGLEGLSIDLVTWNNAGVADYQRGDGPNPPRNSPNRRLETGNAAVNAPQFVSTEFVAVSTRLASNPQGGEAPLTMAENLEVFGTADPETQVTLYRVVGDRDDYGPLSEPLTTVATDENGNFTATLSGLWPGEAITAIATHPQHGTSEPARNAVIRVLNAPPETAVPVPPGRIPQCVTAAPEPPPPAPPPPEPIRIQVPTRIHFALDQSFISATTAKVLDQVVAVMRENPALVVELVGHTDPRASNEYNRQLGLRRARAARDYLRRNGIAPERMTIRSAGETQRVSGGSGRVDYARDRRVELRFQDARGLELIVQDADLQIEP